LIKCPYKETVVRKITQRSGAECCNICSNLGLYGLTQTIHSCFGIDRPLASLAKRSQVIPGPCHAFDVLKEVPEASCVALAYQDSPLSLNQGLKLRRIY